MRKLPLYLTLAVLGAFVPFAPPAHSQDSAPSVAEAARRAKKEKKKSDKATPVITDDMVKGAPADSSATSTASSQSAPATAATQTATTPGSGTDSANQQAASKTTDSSDDKAAKLKTLKKRLVDAQNDLELSQTDVALQQDTYFSNPDYAHDTAGKASLDAKQLDVTQKQQVVAELKAKIAELEIPQNPTPRP
jgi:hypothetical protein